MFQSGTNWWNKCPAHRQIIISCPSKSLLYFTCYYIDNGWQWWLKRGCTALWFTVFMANVEMGLSLPLISHKIKPPRVHSNSHLWFKTTLATLCNKFSLCLPSRGWCMKQKQLLNSQSISSKLMTATLGQSPIGWWRMLCGRTAVAKNTVTRLLWPCYRVSVQSSWFW